MYAAYLIKKYQQNYLQSQRMNLIHTVRVLAVIKLAWLLPQEVKLFSARIAMLSHAVAPYFTNNNCNTKLADTVFLYYCFNRSQICCWWSEKTLSIQASGCTHWELGFKFSGECCSRDPSHIRALNWRGNAKYKTRLGTDGQQATDASLPRCILHI